MHAVICHSIKVNDNMKVSRVSYATVIRFEDTFDTEFSICGGFFEDRGDLRMSM
jgi:hypothetical protein